MTDAEICLPGEMFESVSNWQRGKQTGEKQNKKSIHAINSGMQNVSKYYYHAYVCIIF